MGALDQKTEYQVPDGSVTLEELLVGDAEVIDRLYKEHFPTIRQLVINNSGIHEDAEDVFQETLMITFRKGKYEGLKIRCSLSTYLFAVARNLWLQKLRERKVRNRLEMMVAEPGISSISDNHIEEERRQLFAEHFLRLKPDCQKVLKMAFQQMSLEEISESMGYKGPNYAKTKKFNCKELLKRRITKDPRYKQLFK